MWLLTGPFDGELGDINTQKSKLLKTNHSYPLGRKDRELCVANKKVSHDHCEFFVGEFTEVNALDPSFRPTLRFVNKKDKVMKVMRDGDAQPVNPSGMIDLLDGDIVAILTGIHITVQWLPICCYLQPDQSGPIPRSSCAELGVHFVTQPDPRITHHLIPSLSTHPLTITSLVSACSFVKPEWLRELIRLGKSSPEGGSSSLEKIFSLPQTSKFRPTFGSSLNAKHKLHKVWEPNEERLDMLREFKFICLCDKSRQYDLDLQVLLSRAGASCDLFDVQGGRVRWRNALSHGLAKEDMKLIVLGDEGVVKSAIGQTGWAELDLEARSYGIRIQNPANLMEAILDVDSDLLTVSNTVQPTDTQAPRPIETNPSEPPETEVAGAPMKRLPRRAASVQPPQDSRVDDGGPDVVIQRKVLTRRAAVITGMDDISAVMASVPILNTNTNTVSDPFSLKDLEESHRPRGLKRRAKVLEEESAPFSSQLTPAVDEDGENEHRKKMKKFKALFDDLDPDKQASGDIEVMSQMNGSQTQSQTQFPAARNNDRNNGIVTEILEEEEETQPGPIVGLKRKADNLDADEGTSPCPMRPTKRVHAAPSVEEAAATETATLESSNESAQASRNNFKQRRAGAPTGNPDTDAAFLKALASTKRGKRTEDNFDREFNQLKISKPEIEREDAQDQYALLAEFGDDANIRGNFMVVVELDVLQQNKRTHSSYAGQWKGKPNFKRFKKKTTRTQSKGIDLVLTRGNGESSTAPMFSSQQLKSKSRGAERIDLEDEGGAREPETQLIEAFNKQAQRAASKINSKTKPLFLESDVDDEVEEAILPVLKARATRPRAPVQDETSALKKPPLKIKHTALVDDCSDDDVVFKVTKPKKRLR